MINHSIDEQVEIKEHFQLQASLVLKLAFFMSNCETQAYFVVEF